MNRSEILTHKQKLEIMPDISFMLNIIYETMARGICLEVVHWVNTSTDEFLKFCYTLIVSGLDPKINKLVLNNMVENEENDFKRKKMRIQKDAMLTLQHEGALTYSNLIIFSHLGFEFKSDFINYIHEHNPKIYSLLFKDGDFIGYNLETTIELLNDLKNGTGYYST